MKHLFFLVGLLCLMAAPISSFAQAQNAKDLRKERLEMLKASKSELNEKASKAAKKEAKKLQKEGWQTAPGALPLEKQLDKSYAMQYQYDESMYPMYIMGEAMSIGENYDGAKMQAMELAKQNLAAQIQTEVSGLIDKLCSYSAACHGRSSYRYQEYHGQQEPHRTEHRQNHHSHGVLPYLEEQEQGSTRTHRIQRSNG